MSKAVLTRCARVLAKHLAEYGFEADGRVLRRFNEAGDVVIVELQTHRSAGGGSRFYVNLAFLLAPYWHWQQDALDIAPATQPQTMHASWSDRVNPADWSEEAEEAAGDVGFGVWIIRGETDAEIEAVAGQVLARLRERLPTVLSWLDRDHLREVAGDGDVLGYAAEQTRAWLLAEEGTSAELRALLFGSGSPDSPLARDIDVAVWAYARRHDAA